MEKLLAAVLECDRGCLGVFDKVGYDLKEIVGSLVEDRIKPTLSNIAEEIFIKGRNELWEAVGKALRSRGERQSAIKGIKGNSHALGMSLQEIASIFQVPDGLSKLDELISARQREMDIITLVVSMFGREQEMLGGLSARDMYLLLRTSDISPSLEELLAVFDTLSKQEIAVLFPIKKASSPENIAYLIN